MCDHGMCAAHDVHKVFACVCIRMPPTTHMRRMRSTFFFVCALRSFENMLRTLVSIMLLVADVSAIGNCRGDDVCKRKPTGPSDTCSCWSTCNVDDGARKCDNQNSEWSDYNREDVGGNDVGCTYIPFAGNTRDLCVWYNYNGGADNATVKSA